MTVDRERKKMITLLSRKKFSDDARKTLKQVTLKM